MSQSPFHILAGRKGKIPGLRKDEIVNTRRNPDTLFEFKHQARFWADEIGIEIADQDRQFRCNIERAEMDLRGEEKTHQEPISNP